MVIVTPTVGVAIFITSLLIMTITKNYPLFASEQLVSTHDGKVVTTSLLIANTFGKEHKNVLRDIRELECSLVFQQLNFELSFYIRKLYNGGEKKEPMYYITKDGFTFLAFGFTGKVASRFKEDYINAFNKMEQALKTYTPIESKDYRLVFKDERIKELELSRDRYETLFVRERDLRFKYEKKIKLILKTAVR